MIQYSQSLLNILIAGVKTIQGIQIRKTLQHADESVSPCQARFPTRFSCCYSQVKKTVPNVKMINFLNNMVKTPYFEVVDKDKTTNYRTNTRILAGLIFFDLHISNAPKTNFKKFCCAINGMTTVTKS